MGLRYFGQVCSSSLLPFSNVESLAISCVDQLQHRPRRSMWEAEAPGPSEEDLLAWLDLFYPFSAVKDLDMDKKSLTHVAYILKEVAEDRITEMFPAIRELSIGEQLPSGDILWAIEWFTTARGLSTRLDHPHRLVAG
jgi:hypothetical protein